MARARPAVTVSVDGQGRAQGARRADGVGPVGRPSGTPPPAAVGVAGQGQRDPARLVRHRRRASAAASSSSGRASTPGTGATRSGSSGTGDQAHLEQRDVALPAGDVAPQRLQQGRQHRGPHQRRLLGQRVGHAQRGAPRVVGLQPELVVHLLPDEGVGEHLGEAVVRPACPRRPGVRAGRGSARGRRGPAAARTGSGRSRAGGRPPRRSRRRPAGRGASWAAAR